MGCPCSPASMRALSTMHRPALSHCLRSYEPDSELRAARSAREDRRCPQMKDTIDRPAAVRVLASVPAWKVPVVAMATPVDPSLSAIERDRLAHVAFVTSVNRTNEGKTAQEARDVTQADEDAYEAASGVEEDAVSETEG